MLVFIFAEFICLPLSSRIDDNIVPYHPAAHHPSIPVSYQPSHMQLAF
jgi:hypothetical protein